MDLLVDIERRVQLFIHRIEEKMHEIAYGTRDFRNGDYPPLIGPGPVRRIRRAIRNLS